MRIDVHSHYNPKSLIEAAREYGLKVLPMPPHPDGLAARIPAMDAAEVDLAILWPTFQPSLPDAAAAVRFARFTNDLYHAEIARCPAGRFAAWGCVPLPHVDAAIAEAVRCLDELGFPGIGLGCSVLGQPLDAEAFHPFWAELDRRAAVVFIHPGQASTALPGGEQYFLGPCIGSPAEIGLAGVRLVLSGLTTRFPAIRFVLAVGGGSLPYAWGKIDHLRGMIPGMAPFEGDFHAELAKLYYDTSFPSERVKYRALCELCGAKHIVLGSDVPFGSVAAVMDDLDRITHLSDEEKSAILDRNAADLLFPDRAASASGSTPAIESASA